ncbi:MAG: MFS transporter, partial [Clostridia bacterium]|nr:MFS transporter [Clostridia bacterium]
MQASTKTATGLKPITNKILWIFAVGQFGWSLLSGIVSTWLVHLYTGVAETEGATNGLFAQFITQNPILGSLTIFGVITAFGRIFDAVTDPLIASWSDRAAFKGGRRIPFMKAVAVPFALCTVAIFIVPTIFPNIVLNDVLIFILLMLFYLFMTIYCTPYNALIAELGDTQKNRINVSTYISFTYIAGFSLATLVPTVAGPLGGITGSQGGGMQLAIGILAAIACAAMLLPAFLIKERQYIDSKPVQTKAFRSLLVTFKNGQFRRFVYSDVIYFFAVTLFQTGLADFETKLMGIDSSYTFLLTVLMTVVSLMLYPVVNRLARKLGKKNLIITGFFTYSAVFLITAVCGQGLHWGIIVAVCAGIPMAILGILPQACVADVSELSTLETGEDRSGMFFAARTFAFKMGQAIAMVVFTSLTVSGTKASYRLSAAVAFVTCLIGAIL